MKKITTLLLCALLALPLLSQTRDTGRFYNYYDYNFISPEEFQIRTILVEEANGGKLNFGRNLVIIYSGLSIGQRIKIPGSDIPKAIENLWKQNSFSDVQVFIKRVDTLNRIAINIVIREQPRLSRYKFYGLRQGETKDVREEIDLKKDIYITPNLANRTKNKILKFYREKGFYDATVDVKRMVDTGTHFEKFEIYVNKGQKVKVYDFIFNGNEQLTDAQLRHAVKKIKRRKNKYWVFTPSKFIESKWEIEKENIVKKYQSKGFRDMRILSDSAVKLRPRRVNVHVNLFEGKKYYFRDISWKGNLKFRTTLLDTLLGIKKGDVFNQTLLDERLFANPGGFDIQSLYMDDGYLFFQMVPVETGVFNDSIDMEIRITEGPQARIGKVTWTGNTKTADRVILREIRTKPGDIFSRAEIQRTMRDLVALGLFDPAEMNVNPKPNPANGTVDIEYTMGEKPSDQIELSGGWGGNGFNSSKPSLIGTAGVVLNNFSTRKLFYPKTWNPVPTGDGQKLTLRAQSNGANYQGYTFSFTEPWFGGRRPNSLSVAVFHTVNSFDYRTKKDPLRSVFKNTGVTLSLGKRLKWPDDFFNLQYTLSLQKYNVQNLQGGFYGFPADFKGISYNPSLQIVLARNSVSDPIYPMSGSSFTLSGQATPPFSLIMNLPKYKFAEFYKMKFDAEWYTTVWKKMVFMTKARFGFLGAYNPELGVTFFERFQVGGAGIFGYNIAATEIISQRGYDNYTISRTAMGKEQGAPIYNKFTAELRYALTTGQTATVYGLVFAEAGDAWSSVKKYNPFQLKRAVGVGVRLFMPMFGLIGLDYAYGFDWRQVPSSGKPGQIHFFIGQQF